VIANGFAPITILVVFATECRVYAITAGWAAWVKRAPRADLPEGPLRLGYETFALKIECDTD
jgi:hypothetical protein